jgi:hypothetical protein
MKKEKNNPLPWRSKKEVELSKARKVSNAPLNENLFRGSGTTLGGKAVANTVSGSEILSKTFEDGLHKALIAGMKEALSDPEFKKTVQDQIQSMLLDRIQGEKLLEAIKQIKA